VIDHLSVGVADLVRSGAFYVGHRIEAVFHER
jgi:hypothetical protein